MKKILFVTAVLALIVLYYQGFYKYIGEYESDGSYLKVSPTGRVLMSDDESETAGLMVRTPKGYRLKGASVRFSEMKGVPCSRTVSVGDKVYTEMGSSIPKDIDDLISYTLPDGFEKDNVYHFNDDKKQPVIEKTYVNGESWFTMRIFSCNGYDCMQHGKTDYKDALDSLDDTWRFIIGDGVMQCGMRESDDMPWMVAEAYLKCNRHVIEFRMTNGDEQVTEWQRQIFNEILESVKLK